MKYKEEFKDYFSNKQEFKDEIEAFDGLIKPYEDKLNKDLFEFTDEELFEFINKYKLVVDIPMVTSIIKVYIRFIKEKNYKNNF